MRICIFKLWNGSVIHIAVTFENRKSFEDYLKEAKAVLQSNNFNIKDTEILSFEVGDKIFVKK